MQMGAHFHELSNLDTCCSSSDHKTISLLQALHGKVRPPCHWESSSTCNSPGKPANLMCTRSGNWNYQRCASIAEVNHTKLFSLAVVTKALPSSQRPWSIHYIWSIAQANVTRNINNFFTTKVPEITQILSGEMHAVVLPPSLNSPRVLTCPREKWFS